MDPNELSTTKSNGNGDRAKAINMIQSAFPILTDDQLSNIASYVTLHLTVVNAKNAVANLNATIAGVK